MVERFPARVLGRVGIWGALLFGVFFLATAPTCSDAEGPASRRVVVFSGHTESLTCLGGNRGAKSASGRDEYRFNDEVVRLFETSKSPGIEFIVLPASLNLPLESRAELADRLGACLLVEIHQDNVQPEKVAQLLKAPEKSPLLDFYRGFSLHVLGGEDSFELAQAIESAMIAAGLPYSTFHREEIPGEAMKLVPGTRAIYERPNLMLLKRARVPAVIIECGCIANPKEEQLLQDPAYRQRIATAIQRGIAAYLSRP
ncbi:MAG: N-acetylmuramoyl-L-alanine amidase [Desulfomonile tiedjei]|nr:N-acetylmuramoyl-L-alanine amidase [Desulfomonile tiedjei]